MPIPEQATLQGLMIFLFAIGLLLFFGGTGLVAIEKVFISRSKVVWVTGLIFSIAGFLFFVFGADSKIFPISSQAIAIKPVNLIKSFYFEQEDDLSAMSLGICNNSNPTTEWNKNCYEAKGKLKLVDDGYNSLYSLGSEVELLPDKKQVYSFRFHMSPPIVTQFVSAKVYIPENQSVELISLVSTNDYVEWQAKWLYPKESGWYQVWLNINNDSSTTGNSIVEFHIDIFLPQVSPQAKTIDIKIDDVEFYYPSSVDN